MKWLFVVPSARGLGLGRALTLELMKEATRRGYSKLRLDTLDSMVDAIALYGRLGFRAHLRLLRPCPCRHRLYGAGSARGGAARLSRKPTVAQACWPFMRLVLDLHPLDRASFAWRSVR